MSFLLIFAFRALCKVSKNQAISNHCFFFPFFKIVRNDTRFIHMVPCRWPKVEHKLALCAEIEVQHGAQQKQTIFQSFLCVCETWCTI